MIVCSALRCATWMVAIAVFFAIAPDAILSMLAGPHPRSRSRGDYAPRSGRRRFSMPVGRHPRSRSGCKRYRPR